MLYSVPAAAHIDDVTVVTTIDGKDGVVKVTVAAAGEYAGKGKARLNDIEADLTFRAGTAEATLRVPAARFWSPQDPHLYPLTVTLTDGQRVTDSYTLDIGIRTVAVRGDQLLLNGQPIKLTGFGKHEDFPLHGRGLDLPMWVRDYELLKWVGANSYRTSHYPYAEEAMQLADRLGFLVINEIPAVGLNFEDPEEATAQRLTQCQQQIRELIARDKNHPSTIMWCVANEPMGGPLLGAGPPVPKAVEAGHAVLPRDVRGGAPARRDAAGHARRRAGRADRSGTASSTWSASTATTAGTSSAGGSTRRRRSWRASWTRCTRRSASRSSSPSSAPTPCPASHNTPPEMWTEEYQVEFLRRYLDVAAQRPFMAGMHVWNFADFKTGQGTSRAGGMNFKGVFTRDRRPKMAAHFLRSRWVEK